VASVTAESSASELRSAGTSGPNAKRRSALPAEQHFRPAHFVGSRGVGVEIVVEVDDVAAAFLSKQRTAQALAELFGIPASSGTVAAVTAKDADRLHGFLEHAAGSQTAGFDETGLRVGGTLAWGSPQYAPAALHAEPGRAAAPAARCSATVSPHGNPPKSTNCSPALPPAAAARA
jgi:hypothetical protein